MTIDDLIKTAERAAFRKGFYAGFAASQQDWNGEYFLNVGLDVELNREVDDDLTEALIEAGLL